MNEKDFLSLVEKYKKKKNTNTGTKVTSTSKEEEEFNKLVEKYRQDDFGNRLEAVFAQEKKLDSEELAPVGKKEDEEGLDFFQAPSVFDDGVNVGSVTKSILGTIGDVGVNVGKGAAGLVEGVTDLALYGASAIAKKTESGDLEFEAQYKAERLLDTMLSESDYNAYAKRLGIKTSYADYKKDLEAQAQEILNSAKNGGIAQHIKSVAQKDSVNDAMKGADNFLDNYSVLGKTSDAVFQGVGQVGAILATGGMAGAAGLGSAGATAATTALTGASGMGSGMSEAYKGGATDSEALTYGAIAGAADALTELLFGGLGKSVKAVGLSSGVTSLDDILANKVSGVFKNQIAKNLTEYGIKAGAEGFEEVLAGLTQAIGKKVTYMSEEELGKIIEDENLLEQFVVGAVTSGIAQSGIVPGMKNGSLIEANKTGRDFITGNTQNEQAVIDAEINERIAEAEKDGKKLTGQQKNKIRDQVAEDMEKGYISTDTIERVLGGTSYNEFKNGVDGFMGSDTYKAYNDAISEEKSLREEFEELQKVKITDADLGQQSRFNEVKNRLEEIKKEAKSTTLRKELDAEINRINGLKDRLRQEVSERVKGERLSESYRELQRSTEKFQADPAEYDNEYARKTVQNIVDSGMANNTNETREFVDFMAKISADKGVVFSLTDAERLAGTRYAKDGATTNAYVTDGGEIVINNDSKKRLNSLVGHEVTHVLEGTELYGKLQEAVFAYAQKKGDYDSRLKAITELYQKHDPKADPKKELTADLVGDYLFTDRDFINNLSTEHRNVFQKIYDEIKYLVKMATAGSKEARALEKAKKMFEEAYRENVKGKPEGTGTQFSLYLSESDIPDYLRAGNRKNQNRQKRYEEGQQMVISSDAEFEAFVKGAVEGNPNAMVAYGKVEENLAKQVKEKSGSTINIDGAYLELLSGDVKHAYTEHAQAKEPGDMDMSIEELIDALKNVNQSEVVSAKRHKGGDQRVTLAMPTTDGMMLLVEVASSSAGTLRLKTGWKVTNEKFAQKYRSDTPATGSTSSTNTVRGDTASDAIITQNSEKSIGEVKKSTSDPDIRFSLSETVEETKDLLVLHNLTESKLLKQLELDGFPMPSLAVTNQPHTNFGSISILFNKDTIDPKKNKKNKTYSADAWTPTFPRIEYEADRDVSHNFVETLRKLVDNDHYNKNLSTYLYDVEDSLNHNGGYEGYIDNLAEKPAIQYAFLKAKGENVEIAQRAKEVELGFHTEESMVNRYNSIIKDFSGDVSAAKKMTIKELAENSPTIKALLERVASRSPMQQLSFIGRVLDQTTAYQNYDPNAVLEPEFIPDYAQTEKDMQSRIDTNELKNWLKEQTKGIVANSGVYNGKEIFTPSGNRRSFQQLHYPVTVENIVKSMASQGEKSVTGFNGVKTLRATTAKTFKSIAEIQKAKGKLQNLTEDETNKIHNELSDQMYEVFNKIIGENPKMFRNDDIFALDTIGEVLSEVEYENINASYIKGVFNKYGYNMSSESADAAFRLLDAISSMPVYIFEAKPQRVVGYDEIKAVVIPEDTSIELKNALTERGISFVEYDGTEADRQAKLKDVATANDSYFSLSGTGDTSRTGGGYAVYGDNIRVRDKSEFDFAPLPPVQETVQETSTVTDTEDYPIMENSAPMTEEEANSYDGLEGITDVDAPPVMDAPYYGENEDAAPTDPFEDRDIKDVGNRKVKAYMYENPEVKPFFQEEANIMLGELQRTTKGERFYNMDVYYETNGQAGITGTSRNTSQDIAYLLDELKYSYKQIEAGLKAIIEDNGKENNAVSKRIEFLLNDRLMNGYQDFELGIDIPPNQDYVNLLNEKQIIEYNEEARKRFFDVADDFAPVIETEELPMSETIPTITEPVKDNIESIEPTQTTSTEGTAIKTVKERLEAKVRAVETEIAENKRLREESIRDYDAEIAQKEAEYAAKKNKNTKAANDILRRIERLKRFKSSVDADYAKRISDLEEKATKANEELRSGESTTEQAAMRRDLHSTIIERAKEKFAERGFDFDEVLKNAKDLSTFSTVDNTPQRVMEKALGYKAGQVLADLTVNKVAQNETEGIKWLNSFTNRKKGLLADISKRYQIKPGSKESAAAQMYAEGFYVNGKNEVVEYGDRELALDFRNAKTRENIKGLASDPRIRQIYDETLDKINESRARNAYPEIKKLDNYYLHFRAMDDTFSKLGVPFNPNDIRAKDLPTDLNGVTADLKPGQPYFSSAMHRRGNRTSFDLLGGLERYLTSAKDQIYHIDDIQTLRAMRNYVADSFGQAKGLEDLDLLTEEEAQAKIEQVYNSHLSTFAKFLNEEANVIAGKTALIDRGLEGVVGRRGMTIIDTINRQVGANMVGFNVSSSLTNFLAPVQAFAKTNKAAFTKAFAQTVFNKVGSIVGKTDGFIENNPTMIRRQGAERFYRTPWQKAGDAGYVLMGAVDSISTELIVRAKYNELIGKGMSEQDAVTKADKWASRLMGDRSLGQQPQLYNSKTLGILTKFQLEVRNQLDSQFYDTIQEAKVSNEETQNALWRNTKTAAKVTSTFFQLAVAQHLFGKVFESIAGYNPAFDIIEAIIKTFGWDDEEDSEDTTLDNIGQGFLSLLEDMPYSSLATGGRVPMASALPIEQLIKGKDQYGNEKSRLETVKETIPYYVLPGGYGQIKKTTQGLGMFDDSLPIAGSYTDSGNLRFPVDETPKNIAQAAIFGQYASDNARDYFDNERQPLKEKQIQEFIDVDIPIREYWDYREGLKDLQTIDEKFDYIASLDLPIDKKNILVNNVTDRKEPVDLTDYDEFKDYEEFDYAVKNPEKYEFLQSVGVSVDEYQSFDDDTKDAYTWAYNNPEGYTLSKAAASDVVTYREYAKALDEIKADKDADGKTISGSRKEKVINYLNTLDADYGEKLILFKNEYNADDTYNYEIIDYLNNREDLSYAETVTILRKLGFTVDAEGNIYW